VVLALAVLAGLGGCGKMAQSGVESPAGSSSSEAASSVETSSSVEYVPQDRFEDANIINTEFTRANLAQNPKTGSLGAATDWAVLFVTQNYKAFSPKYIYVDSLSSTSPDPSIFVGNETSFVLRTFCVNFETDGAPNGLTPEEDGSYNLNLQVVMKESKDHQLTLLGFVTNQKRDINRSSDLAEFLKVIPEFKNLEIAVPKPDAPLESINLTELTGGLHIIGVWPVGDALYIFGYDPDFRLIDGSLTALLLKAYSFESLSLLYEKTFPLTNSSDTAFFIEDESLIFTPDRTGGQPYFRATKNGAKEIDYTPADEKADKLYRLSDTAVIRESGVDLLLEKDGKTIPLLTGVPGDNAHEYSCYSFRYRIDDSSFVYLKMGWEWVIESGIYNIETGKITLLSHENAQTLVPIAVQNGKIILSAYYDMSYTSLGPYLYDIASGQITDLGWFDKTFRNYYTTFLQDENTLAAFSKTDSALCVLLCDLTKETTPRRFETFNYNLAEPTRIFKSGGYLWFCSQAEPFSDAYLFRIPIEK